MNNYDITVSQTHQIQGINIDQESHVSISVCTLAISSKNVKRDRF